MAEQNSVGRRCSAKHPQGVLWDAVGMHFSRTGVYCDPRLSGQKSNRINWLGSSSKLSWEPDAWRDGQKWVHTPLSFASDPAISSPRRSNRGKEKTILTAPNAVSYRLSLAR